MIDEWFGRVLDEFDAAKLWDDTALVVCTDHGHYLGEVRGGHDIWGKPGVPQYEPLGHTPLLDFVAGRRRAVGPATRSPPASTCSPPSPTCSTRRSRTPRTARSLAPLLTGDATVDP